MQLKEIAYEAIKKIDGWITLNHWKGYEPFDGLSTPLVKLLTLNNHYLRIMLQQFVRRFPVNLRPLIGVKKRPHSNGLGFCAAAYLRLYKLTKAEDYLEKARFCLEGLKITSFPGYTGYCWGDHFTYESRGGRIPLLTPTIVWTSHIGNAFLDGFEILGDRQFLEVAKSSAQFILNDIARYIDSESATCFMYTPIENAKPAFEGCIHNSNLLGASLLARVYKRTREMDFLNAAEKAVNFAIKYQLEHGGWWYGEPTKFHWEDSFHTAYNLESIHHFMEATGDHTYFAQNLKGYRYWINTFFGEDGTPRYYSNKVYPLDIQCATQGIQTLSIMHEYDPASLETASKVLAWTIGRMQDPSGYFYYRKYPVVINKTPMFHWGQATMLSALAKLLDVIAQQ